jgi:single-strand DNA-binding protein
MNMGSVNKVFLIGNLGNDPELKSLEGGKTVTNFSIATNERWKDKLTGEDRERTEWHRIVAWGKTAELAAEYLGKGRTVCIEGRLQTRSWKDKDGVDRYTTEVVADELTFLGGRRRSDDQSDDADDDAEQAAA